MIDSAWSRFSWSPSAVLALALAAQTWPSAVSATPPQPQMPPPPGSPPTVLTTTHWWSTAADFVAQAVAPAFVVYGLYAQSGPRLGVSAAVADAIGLALCAVLVLTATIRQARHWRLARRRERARRAGDPGCGSTS